MTWVKKSFKAQCETGVKKVKVYIVGRKSLKILNQGSARPVFIKSHVELWNILTRNSYIKKIIILKKHWLRLFWNFVRNILQYLSMAFFGT